MNRSAFTLIELLITVFIIVILLTVTILILDPYSFVLESHDAQRISDLKALNGNLDFYHGNGGPSLGSANTVYISIPDSVATSTAGDQCQGLGLPLLPAIDVYHCAASSTYRNTDGTGWIPVNFSGVQGGNLLGVLPVDPVNTSSSRDYYTYTTANGQWELTEAMEAPQDQFGGADDEVSTDGGHIASLRELGTNLNLEPLDYGDPSLILYATFDEGTGSVAYDYSGHNTTGSIQGGATWTTGKINGGLSFDGVSTTRVLYSNFALGYGPYTMSAWIYPTAVGPGEFSMIMDDYVTGCAFAGTAGNYFLTCTSNGFPAQPQSLPYSMSLNQWQWVAAVRDSLGRYTFYINGVQSGAVQYGGAFIGSDVALQIGAMYPYGSLSTFEGTIDDVRIYNRALSAAQISGLYNSDH